MSLSVKLVRARRKGSASVHVATSGSTISLCGLGGLVDRLPDCTPVTCKTCAKAQAQRLAGTEGQ